MKAQRTTSNRQMMHVAHMLIIVINLLAPTLLFALPLDSSNSEESSQGVARSDSSNVGGPGPIGLIKRATTSHAHNIMRFGRAGHNIMHFGKRGEEAPSGGDVGDYGVTSAGFMYPDSETLQQQAAASSYEQQSAPSGGLSDSARLERALRARYFIPHAFIASLYSHPRPFLKKAGEGRDNVFMHFGK